MGSSPAHEDPLSVGVATPERVALSLPIAGIGSRTGAYLVDAALLLFFWVTLYFVFSLTADVVEAVRGLSGVLQTVLVLGAFGTHWAYWTVCEVFWNGQTPGKRVAKIRVVRDDGSPVGLFESAVRNLLRVVDLLPALYGIGVISILATRDGRRLGDLAAGTLLVREERFDLDRYTVQHQTPAESASSAASGAVALATADLELILSFLERAPSLAPDARARLAATLYGRFSSAATTTDAPAAGAGSAADHERFLRTLVQRAHG